MLKNKLAKTTKRGRSPRNVQVKYGKAKPFLTTGGKAASMKTQ
jgi:hypothetical protein